MASTQAQRKVQLLVPLLDLGHAEVTLTNHIQGRHHPRSHHPVLRRPLAELDRLKVTATA